MSKKSHLPAPAQRPRWWAWGSCILILVTGGCSAPAVEGYQLQGTPEGFLYAQLQDRSPGLLGDRAVAGQGMWLGDIRLDEPHTTILVTTYRGGAARRDVEEVRDARAQRVENFSGVVVGPVRDLPLKLGGTAWVWTEERYNEYGRFRSLNVSGVASFDSVSFGLDFNTDVPERMNAAHADSVLATFGLGRVVVHWNAVLAAVGLLALVAVALIRRMGPRHSSGYSLWEKEEPPKSPSGATPSSPSSPPLDAP